MIDFIDLGCGNGESINWVQKRFGGSTFLGIDNRMDDFLKAVESGHSVVYADITDKSFVFPKTRFITMLHVLEHLRDETTVKDVIRKSIEASSNFVFIKGPTFENLDYLKNLGFKITWTDWLGHPTPVNSEMLRRIAEELGVQIHIKFQYPISDSESNEIIPITAPVDTIYYSDTLRKKNYTKFYNVYREIVSSSTLIVITGKT